jgi:hypothetical protein
MVPGALGYALRDLTAAYYLGRNSGTARWPVSPAEVKPTSEAEFRNHGAELRGRCQGSGARHERSEPTKPLN